MSRTRGIRFAVVAAIAVSLTVGCSDLLDVAPTGSVPPDVATGNSSALQAVLNSAYQRLTSQGAGGQVYWSEMMIVPDVLADNGRPSVPPNQLQGQAVNQVGSQMGGWSVRYQGLDEANYVIESAPKLSGASESLKNRLEGEALFLRALYLFDLARIFAYEPGHVVNGWDQGPVIRTVPTKTLGDAEPKARSTVAETYQQIESDLKQSIDLLASSGGTSVYYATQAAAEALLGRVYLYWERWSDAVTYSTAAMNHASAHLATPSEYPTMFNKQPNLESLFELSVDQPNLYYANYCMACYLLPQYFFSIWPTDELMGLFEPGDVRLSLYGESNGVTYLANKWTSSVDGQYNDNVPVIRYSEVLLNRAEAYAEAGDEASARADVNALRAQRSLGPIADTGQALMDAILKERRKELAFEGQRWFDLKRRGLDIPKPASSGLGPLPYSDFRILAPLPNNEVQSDALLQQNPGY